MNYLLFTTTRCQKCPEFKNFVQENIEFEGEILNETMDNFTDMIVTHNATSAPLLIIFNNKEEELFRTTEIYELQEYLEKQ